MAFDIYSCRISDDLQAVDLTDQVKFLSRQRGGEGVQADNIG